MYNQILMMKTIKIEINSHLLYLDMNFQLRPVTCTLKSLEKGKLKSRMTKIGLKQYIHIPLTM